MFEYDEKALSSAKTEEFVVGLGCFWGVETKFGSLDGVIRTSCGYCGGERSNPTYRNIKDHTETVRVEYDPNITNYRELAQKAISMHNPKSKNRKTQYDNVIFYKNQKEKNILSDIFQEKGYDMSDLETRIEKLSTYYYAEDYHQKYNLKNHRSLENQFTEVYDEEEIRDSSLATKINSVVDGKLDQSDLSISDEIEFDQSIFDRIIRNFKN